jgi:two-component system NtrC family response regulator
MSDIQVLIIDDEADVCTFFRRLLTRRGYGVVTALNERSALEALGDQPFHVAMVDLKLPDTDGLTLLRQIKARQPACEVVIMTGFSTIKTAVTAIQLGAYEYLEKPFEDIAEIEQLIEKAAAHGLNALEGGMPALDEWSDVARAVGFQVGASPEMRRMVSMAHKIAGKNINVLIQGKTGTGKEVLAHFIHAASPRADQTFIPVNCGALPENLLESELFGHEKGAFTGAGATRRGIFELANRGTLFLDEIGDASPSIQVKLLRVLETGEFMRVGGEKPIRSDVRIISATNVNLEEAVRDRTFREDLYYRLNVVRLEIPPLSARREDIPMMAEFFVRQFNPGLSLAPATLRTLCDHAWPGNLRELANLMRRASVLATGDTILPDHLGPLLDSGRFLRPSTSPDNPSPAPAEHPASPRLESLVEQFGREEVLNIMAPEALLRFHNSLLALNATLLRVMSRKGIAAADKGLRDFEVEAIRAALEQNHWNITETAQMLGIGRNTLHRKIKKYRLKDS